MGPQLTENAYDGGNVILDRLAADECRALLPGLTVCLEEEGAVPHERDQPIEMVHFPIDTVYSVVAELDPGQMYEVDVLGRASVVGAELALGAHVTSRTVLCQVGGRVAQLPSAQFMVALDRSRTFLMGVRESLRRHWFASQQTLACNFAHTLEQRAARWILLTQDDVSRERFSMRGEFLSIMLGIAETKIHEPLTVLTELGCISYKDEQLTVRSRSALEDYACECYERQRTAPFITLDRMP